MKFETVKLPEGVAFGEVERQMRGRKKLLLLTKQQSSRSFENQRSSSVMGSSVRNIVVDESLLKTATAVEMIDHLELTRLVYIEDKFNRARLFLMSSNTLIRELYRKSLNEVVQDAGNLLGRIEASKVCVYDFSKTIA